MSAPRDDDMPDRYSRIHPSAAEALEQHTAAEPDDLDDAEVWLYEAGCQCRGMDEAPGCTHEDGGRDR